jgi:hypothetical protein
MTAEWLVKCCDPADGGKSREWLRQPMSATLRGKRCAVALNGYLLAAVEGEHGYPEAGTNESRLAEIVPNDGREIAVMDAVQVQAWCGPVVPDEIKDCPECKGTGRTACPECDGTGEACCGSCGSEIDCEECDDGMVDCDCEAGKIVMESRRPGRIGDVLIDRQILAKAIFHVAGLASIRVHPELVELVGDGWYILICARSKSSDDKEEYPQLIQPVEPIP